MNYYDVPEKISSDVLYNDGNGTGYYLIGENDIWIWSWFGSYAGAYHSYPLDCNDSGLRPVVCLKAGVTLEKVGDGRYNLVAPPAPVLPTEDTLLASNEGDETSESYEVTFTVPEGVNVLQISALARGNDENTSWLWVKEDGVTLIPLGCSMYDLMDETIYVSVTPGNTYTLSGITDGNVSNSSIFVYYSQSINEQTPTFDLDAPVVTFTNTSVNEANIIISGGNEIDFSLSSCKLSTTGTKVKNENEWNAISHDSRTGNAPEVTSKNFTISMEHWDIYYVHLRLVDVLGNVYYYTSDFSISSPNGAGK